MRIKKRTKLIVISHTAHYFNEEKKIAGWAPTVNEINYIAENWEEVVHLGCFNGEKEAPSGVAIYKKSNIRFVPLPYFTDIRSKDGIMVFKNAFRLVRLLEKEIVENCDIQLRLPTGFAFVYLPYFFFRRGNFNLWAKYGGNWVDKNVSKTFKIQKWFLKKGISVPKATINGKWTNQKKHIFTFENPCLTDEDINIGKKVIANKNWEGSLTAIFVGRLESFKGIDKIINLFDNTTFDRIGKVEIVGDGPLRAWCEEKSKGNQTMFNFHGFVSQREIHHLLSESHILILPSESEGFPKVVAEGACFGCIPVVTDISCIGQYINEDCGILMKNNTVESLGESIEYLLSYSDNKMRYYAQNLNSMASSFTYNSYMIKLEKYILP